VKTAADGSRSPRGQQGSRLTGGSIGVIDEESKSIDSVDFVMLSERMALQPKWKTVRPSVNVAKLRVKEYKTQVRCFQANRIPSIGYVKSRVASPSVNASTQGFRVPNSERRLGQITISMGFKGQISKELISTKKLLVRQTTRAQLLTGVI
jgi:hypothetical protein